MMQEEYHISLKPYNTFGIDVLTDKLIHIQTLGQLNELIASKVFITGSFLILGGGSNILLTQDVKGVVIRNELKGIELLKEDDNFVWVKAMGGEVWHEFVLWNIERNYGGVENLSLIPGTVGAAPMQNIGAYGVEIKDTFESLEALDLKTGELKVFLQRD